MTGVSNHNFLPALEQAGGINRRTNWLLGMRGNGAWGNRGIQNSHSNAMNLEIRWLAIWLADAWEVVLERMRVVYSRMLA